MLGMLGVEAQVRSDAADAGLVEQGEGGVADERHHGRSLSQMNQTGIFAEGNVFLAMQPILDRPMTAA